MFHFDAFRSANPVVVMNISDLNASHHQQFAHQHQQQQHEFKQEQFNSQPQQVIGGNNHSATATAMSNSNNQTTVTTATTNSSSSPSSTSSQVNGNSKYRFSLSSVEMIGREACCPFDWSAIEWKAESDRLEEVFRCDFSEGRSSAVAVSKQMDSARNRRDHLRGSRMSYDVAGR